MKETGIIMTGDHPKLILDNRKTMTRRTRGLKEINENPDGYDYPMVYKGVSGDWWAWFQQKDSRTPMIVKCPYGGVGDRLWVRETVSFIDYCLRGEWEGYVKIKYEADSKEKWIKRPDSYNVVVLSKHPSIFMPRWASRILLEITALRVERLQEITREDALAEGIETLSYGFKPQGNHNKGKPWGHPISAYADLWDSLNAKRGYGWDKNPWVWVISFRRLQ